MPWFEVQYHLRSGKDITGTPLQSDNVQQAATSAYASLERAYVITSHGPSHAVLIPKESVEFIILTQTDDPDRATP